MTRKVLTPSEAAAIGRHLRTPELHAAWSLMLYTGVRHPELMGILEGQAAYHSEDRLIYLPGSITKTSKQRTVHLPHHTDHWLRYALTTAESPVGPNMRRNIQRAAQTAGIEGVDDIGVKTPRKTLECWLFMTYPERAMLILSQMGHTSDVSLMHYLEVPFGGTTKEAIKAAVWGWMA